ncbi:MAG: alanine--tRNA ligase [Patescibacteria group bacterium]|jgi:alanyl-tRNA synthetase
MKASELREKYLKFFESKGHVIVPSASLIPENDPTTLFTSAGMQPMIPYLLGEKHPSGNKLVDSQKCFRTQDIDEAGDARHTTFFEMLGNWSLGDYFKKEQIGWMFEFLTKEIGLDSKRIYVTVFRGKEDIGIAKDEEAVKLWQEQFAAVGVEAKAVDLAEKNGLQDGRIFYYDETKNWWSRSGVTANMPVGEPGGPDSEMFWDFGAELGLHEKSVFADQPCHVNCDCGRFMEIGNNVFMQYIKTDKGFEELKNKNIDFGGGLERMTAAVNGTPDVFNIDLFAPIKGILEKLSGKVYNQDQKETKAFRVIIDHLRAATFLIADGAAPSNKEQGYFTRRLIRRAVRFAHDLGISKSFCAEVAKEVVGEYSDFYPYLLERQTKIIKEITEEEVKFKKTLELGIKEFERVQSNKRIMDNDPCSDLEDRISGETAFYLYQSFGFPIEMIIELAKEKDIEVDIKDFSQKLKEHQDLSRTASAGMFKGGLADAGVETTRLHTAAHLMLEALRRVLGDHVSQKGSNITAERLRFDFSHGEKMTPEQLKQVENIVNEQIAKKLPVVMKEMTLDEARQMGATGVFENKYGDKVKVYSIGDFSREICGGPHVENASELGHFKITKEESSSSGVRRIKAVLE